MGVIDQFQCLIDVFVGIAFLLFWSLSGPGATNLVTGIATAYMDSVPMVAITANVTLPLLGKDSFQEVQCLIDVFVGIAFLLFWSFRFFFRILAKISPLGQDFRIV